MSARMVLIMVLSAAILCLGPGPSWSRAEQTCRDCHPLGFSQGGRFERIPDGWSVGDLVSSGYDSPCPGLADMAVQVDMTNRTLHRLDLLIQNQKPEDEGASGRRLALEALAWRRLSIFQQPPGSAAGFARQTTELRDEMDIKIFLPLISQDMDNRVRFSSAVLLAGLIVTVLLWLYRRFRLKSYER